MAHKPLVALCAAAALSIGVITPAFADTATTTKTAAVSFASLTHQGKQPLTNRYAVKRSNTASLEAMSTTVASAAASVGAKVVKTHEFAEGYQIVTLDGSLTSSQHDAFTADLLRKSNVSDVAVDERVWPLAEPNDPDYPKLWSFQQEDAGMRVNRAWNMTKGKGVVVGVVDTGIIPHADLVGNTLPGYDFVSSASKARDGDGADSDPTDEGDWNDAGDSDCGSDSKARESTWHGSHVAGTIAAVGDNGIGPVGVAPQAKLLPVRALAKCGGSIFDIGYAITWAAGHDLKDWPVNPNKADVINMSIGGKGACNNLYQTALNTATRLGSIPVVAAGNSQIDIKDAMPANCQGVISVAATNKVGGKSYYSNFGAVTISAPGGDKKTPGGDEGQIYSTVDRGLKSRQGDGYAYYQGTSMATPHVAGLVALLRSIKKNMSTDEAIGILQRTARPLLVSCPEGCGAGIADAEAAVRAAGGRPTEEPTPTNTPKPTSTPKPTTTPTSAPVNGEVEVTNSNFRDIVAQSADKPIVVVAGATWSKATQTALPLYRDRLTSGNDFVLARLDGDKYKDALAFFAPKAYPTAIGYSNGNEMQTPARLVGVPSAETANQFVDSVVAQWKKEHSNNPSPTTKPTSSRPPTGGPIKPGPTTSPTATQKPTPTATATNTAPDPGTSIGNGDFELGAESWSGDTDIIGDGTSDLPANRGSKRAAFGGLGKMNTKTLSHPISVPSGKALTFYLAVSTKESTTVSQYDKLFVRANNELVATFSNLDKSAGYVKKSVDLSKFAGRDVMLSFTSDEDSTSATSFLLDDLSFE